MIQELFRQSLRLLRRPTLATFEEVGRDEWRPALAYYLLALAASLVAQVVSAALWGGAQSEQLDQLRELEPGSPMLGVLEALQRPEWIVAFSLVSSLIGLAVWLGGLYGIGRLMGGRPALARFFYVYTLYLAPLSLLLSLLGLVAVGPLQVLVGLVGMASTLVFIYCDFQNLRASLGLTTGRAAITLAIPFSVMLLCMCAVFAIAFLTVLGTAIGT